LINSLQDISTLFPALERIPANSSKPLLSGQTPLDWVEKIDVAAVHMKPFKHRKFIEKVCGSAEALRGFAMGCSDFQVPTEARHANAAEHSLNFDLHAFHSSVIPSLDKQ
jgi:hypothetical protein